MFVTPRKKRPAAESDDEVLTPKKVRSLPLSPPPTRHKSSARSLPSHLARLLDLHKSIEQTLSVALATSSSRFTPAAGKDGETSSFGYMPNVINHLNLANTGHIRRCTVQDLSRLVWLWEWDGESLPDTRASPLEAVNDDPFVEIPKDWKRGGSGIIVTQTLHSSRALAKRVPAYGIGIEVDTFGKGMSAIAQWTSDAEKRRLETIHRLESWVDLHTKERAKQRQVSRASSPTPSPVPNIPYSALPRLPATSSSTPTSALARDLLHATARKPNNVAAIPFPTPSSTRVAARPESPSPVKRLLDMPVSRPITPETPRRDSVIPQTPTSSRRAALMERVRLKSLGTPSKGSVQITAHNSEGEEVHRTIGPEDVKRRLLLGRLGNVADAVWMLFASTPQSPSSNPTPPTRRRRAIPIEEVVRVVIKSARSPISTAEATESLRLLSSIGPDFLKLLVIDGEEWLQMASSSAACPPSPSSKRDNEEEVRKRKTGGGSPVKIRSGAVTLRDIKERIRREMDV